MELNTEINKKTVIGSLAWKFFERFVSQGLSLVIQIVLARILLPEDFGSLAIIAAITNYAALFVQSGIATAIVQKNDLDDLDVSTVFMSSMGLAIVFYLILFFLSPWIADFYNSPILSPTLRVLSLVLFLNAINSVQTAILSRRMQFKRLFMRSLFAVPISGFVGITMAYLGFDLWALVAYNLTNMLVVVLVMNIGSDMKIKKGFSWERARKIYNFSGKILLSSLVSGGHDIIRTMTIGKKYTSADLAYYDKAYTYSYYIVTILNSTVSSVMLPTFSKSQDNLIELKRISRLSVKLSAFIMIPLLVGAAVVSYSLVLILLTDKWLPCVPFLALFCVLRIPGIFMSIDRQVYYAIGRSDINLYYEISLCALNLICFFVAVHYGIIWIAICACIIEFLGLIAVSILSSRLYGYSIIERINDLWKTVLASIIMGLCVYSLPDVMFVDRFVLFIVQVILGITIYLAISLLLKNENIYYIKILITK